MSIFKCKMCGGDLEIAEGITIAECDYCGTKQTVPKAMDENLQNLFNRANTLRIKSEFDKAEKIYEKIIQADPTQSEAYWGLILCKYGIEYVDDPTTFKKIPTCHRTSYDSVIADDDYKSALENADLSQRALYEQQAKEIDRIQKDILALAQKEETYDVFICYKETDAYGKRTQDSVIANDIYYQLTQEGFKVFYAAITLEGKLGSAYEPIIFAALNSAKVMLSIGTKPEYFNAVWVKNEWSRYLKIIKKDRSKLLIPCYRDMDAYELPEEFAHLQAQDMSKIGFINDIVRGIKKVVTKDEPKTTTVVKETVVESANTNVAPLLKRAFIFIGDGDWKSADEYCEKALDIDPENAEIYVCKLLVEYRKEKLEDLKNGFKYYGDSNNFKKALLFSKGELKSKLNEYYDYYNKNIAPVLKEIGMFSFEKLPNSKFKINGIRWSSKLSSDMTIPNCVEIIGHKAFANCTKIVNLTIPNSVTIVENEAFSGCTNLINVTISDGVKSIREGTFAGCTNLISVAIPDSVTSIEEGAFNGCSALTTINIPNSVTSIGEGAFARCTNLESIALPFVGSSKTATEAGPSTQFGFIFGTKYNSNMVETTQNFDKKTVYYLPKNLKKVTVTGGAILKDAFQCCKNLTSVTLSEGVTSIGGCAFWSCSSLTSVTIPNTVTSIENAAFSYCSSLTSVTIPNCVSSIGSEAFNDCSSLTSITIPNTVTSIGWGAFSGCSSLTSINIPNCVSSIESEAFYGCSSLTSITIPNTVTSIEAFAFTECSSLTNITIPNSVASIENEVFKNCTSLTNITLPNGLTSIGDEAFKNCTSLTNITLPNGLTSIGDEAFSGCYALNSITIPESVTSIGKGAFRGCPSLTNKTIPDSVTNIGEDVFGTESKENPSQKTSGGCYVATCVYGSYDCPEVWTLRRFRDNTLGATWYGRLFIRTYYAISPTIVKWFGNTGWFKKLWKGKLDRMVSKLQANGVEDTPYNDKVW